MNPSLVDPDELIFSNRKSTIVNNKNIEKPVGLLLKEIELTDINFEKINSLKLNTPEVSKDKNIINEISSNSQYSSKTTKSKYTFNIAQMNSFNYDAKKRYTKF